jgi:hypothetical protein
MKRDDMRIASLLVISLMLAVILLTAVTGQVSASMLKMTLEDLVTGAELIVVGEVTDIACYEEGKGNIYTQVILLVERIIKGDCGQEVVIRVPGGEVGNIVLWVEDMPGFARDERVLVFLQKCVDGTWFEDCQGSYIVYGGFQGKSNIGRYDSLADIVTDINKIMESQGITPLPDMVYIERDSAQVNWWVVGVIAGVLLVMGLAIFIFIRRRFLKRLRN